MSTPITHNALFILSTMKTIYALEGFGILSDVDKEALTYSIVRECVALYNYPDAVQAVRRPDGTILSRRVTHFESAKEFGNEPNSHKLFSPDFLKIVGENDKVWGDSFHDTEDQDGDVMGQYTDWYAWSQEKDDYQRWASNAGKRRAMLLAEMVDAHLTIADWLNDQMFRKYVSTLADGSIMIGRAKFGPEEKREAFGLFKNLIMSIQEQSALIELATYFDSVDQLNATVEDSYKETFSPWLAGNSLRFVKPFSFEELFEPSNEQLQLLSEAGIDYCKLEDEAERFIMDSVTLTSEHIWGAMEFIGSIRQELSKQL